MKVPCPTCNTSYTISEKKIPQGKRGVAACKKCGSRIVVHPDLHDDPMLEQASPASASLSNVLQNRSMRPSNQGISPMLMDYPELQSLSLEKFELATIMPPNKHGGYKSRRNKIRVKVLMAVHAVLSKILQDGEKVMCIGKGTASYPFEILFGNGYLTLMYNHYAVACTDRRLLFININPQMKQPTHYVFQMPYEHIKKVKKGLLMGGLVLQPFQGKRRTFTNMKRYFAKEIHEFIAAKRESMPLVKPAEELLENLCPACFVPLPKGLSSCPACTAGFKEPKKALLKSLVMPGWGDFYLGHRALGGLELVGSLFVWMIVVSLVLQGGPWSLIVPLFLLFLYNGFDAVITYHMGKKGYMRA